MSHVLEDEIFEDKVVADEIFEGKIVADEIFESKAMSPAMLCNMGCATLSLSVSVCRHANHVCCVIHELMTTGTHLKQIPGHVLQAE